ncbi:MAG: lipopolysaccharide assembly protein LapB [Leptothrix sp. (in: b-proteobacteria)]
MDFDLLWLLLALPVAFAFGWLASRTDLRHWQRDAQTAPRAYFKGLNLLLNEQQDKAIDAFIEAVQHDPGSSDLHFALGNLFRRRGEYERAVRVHQHLLARADLPASERDRAQHALAQDFLKAGLFDRAEAAFKALEGTAFGTDARLALLTLHERARDWRAAIEVARGLESVAAGSFAQRIAHHGCELTLEADAAGDIAGADQALQQARQAAPQAARPLILAGQRLARAGQHAEALAVWLTLSTLHPDAFSVIAPDYAASARACDRVADALVRLADLYAAAPSSDLLLAIVSLEPDAQVRRQWLVRHMRQHAGLSAALRWLEEPSAMDAASEGDWPVLRQNVAQALRPLQRYHCAACGFEAQTYFWQCPGCQGWDTYPPRRVEDL